MYWQDEGYLLFKNNFDENSIIIECFTSKHGKCVGVVYGGNSRKNKKLFQIGNKILLNYRNKNENKTGYFTIELIKPISPKFFDDKKRAICILSASSILKILLPERQTNTKIYSLFENLLDEINQENWIKNYVLWELSIVKELGFEIDLSSTIEINNKVFKIPKLLNNKKFENISNYEIKQALIFSKNLLIENFIFPNRLRFPLSRNILEKYFN